MMCQHPCHAACTCAGYWHLHIIWHAVEHMQNWLPTAARSPSDKSLSSPTSVIVLQRLTLALASLICVIITPSACCCWRLALSGMSLSF